jgi:hypothetical protein
MLRHSTVPAGVSSFNFFGTGTWNRRSNRKNNGSMSFSSFVACGRWNVVFAQDFFMRQPLSGYQGNFVSLTP